VTARPPALPPPPEPAAASITLAAADARGIARLTISHPGKLNALNLAMWGQLRAVFEALAADPAPPRVVVLRGAGGHFVAGADIAEFPQFRFDAATLAAYHEDVVAPALRALYACAIPLVAQIEGPCIGGGLEIAAGCDIRLAGPDARFGVPIARLGFPMAPAEVELVAAAIGPALLRELLIDARLLDADEALRRGLVSRVIGGDAQALTAEVARTAERIAALSPQALRLNKQVLRAFAGRGAGGGSSRDDRLPHYGYADSAEHREGLRAFLEKRPPAW